MSDISDYPFKPSGLGQVSGDIENPPVILEVISVQALRAWHRSVYIGFPKNSSNQHPASPKSEGLAPQ